MNEMLLGGVFEDEGKITYAQLLESNAEIKKKIVVINSTKYTDEAFDYLLDLVDKNEAIAFIPDERQIYAQGTWFGGDVWEDTLDVFSKFLVVDADGNVTGSLIPSSMKDVLEIQGEGGIDLYTEYDAFNDRNRLHINYRLETAVDEDAVITLPNNDKVTLTVVSDKISMKQHDASSVTFGSTTPLEYDLPQAHIGIPVYIKDISKLSSMKVSANVMTTTSFDLDTMTVNALVPSNTDVMLTIDYTYDGIGMTTEIEQKWGFGWYYGSTRITSDTFGDLVNAVSTEFEEMEITIDQELGRYGWVAFPKEHDLVFIDADTGVSGGWMKYATFTKYSKRIEYQVYRTRYAGLGSIKWKIHKK